MDVRSMRTHGEAGSRLPSITTGLMYRQSP